MSPELIAILGVGVAIAGLLLASHRNLNSSINNVNTDLKERIDSVNTNLNTRIDRHETNVNARFDGLDTRMRSVETGLAELKGQMSIVRDYMQGRNSKADDPKAAPAE